MTKKSKNYVITYLDDDQRERLGEVIENNGNLTLVVDQETGEESYRAPIEIRENW